MEEARAVGCPHLAARVPRCGVVEGDLGLGNRWRAQRKAEAALDLAAERRRRAVTGLPPRTPRERRHRPMWRPSPAPREPALVEGACHAGQQSDLVPRPHIDLPRPGPCPASTATRAAPFGGIGSSRAAWRAMSSDGWDSRAARGAASMRVGRGVSAPAMREWPPGGGVRRGSWPLARSTRGGRGPPARAGTARRGAGGAAPRAPSSARLRR